MLTLRALAKRLGRAYGTLRNEVMILARTPHQIEIDGYKIFGRRHTGWYAYDPTKYEVTVLDDPGDAAD